MHCWTTRGRILSVFHVVFHSQEAEERSDVGDFRELMGRWLSSSDSLSTVVMPLRISCKCVKNLSFLIFGKRRNFLRSRS